MINNNEGIEVSLGGDAEEFGNVVYKHHFTHPCTWLYDNVPEEVLSVQSHFVIHYKDGCEKFKHLNKCIERD